MAFREPKSICSQIFESGSSKRFFKCPQFTKVCNRLLGLHCTQQGRFTDTTFYFGTIFHNIGMFFYCFVSSFVLNIFGFKFCGTYSFKGVPSCEPKLWNGGSTIYLTDYHNFKKLFTSSDSPDLVYHTCHHQPCTMQRWWIFQICKQSFQINSCNRMTVMSLCNTLYWNFHMVSMHEHVTSLWDTQDVMIL